MLLSGWLAQPVFWYLDIWRDAPVSACSTVPALLVRTCKLPGVGATPSRQMKPLMFPPATLLTGARTAAKHQSVTSYEAPRKLSERRYVSSSRATRQDVTPL